MLNKIKPFAAYSILALSALTLTPAIAEAVGASNGWLSFNGSQEQCTARARAALGLMNYSSIKTTGSSTYGDKGDYTTGIRCVSSYNIVFFFTAGPKSSTASDLNASVRSNF